jgi:hydroxyethylthiazole kinase
LNSQKDIRDALGLAFERMQAARPLVQCITNYVAMNVAANALLAVGASPAMVHGVEEAEEFAGIASALTINIGTISGPWLDGMLVAVRGAKTAGRVWVLDPVAVGATPYRNAAAARLLALKPDVVRGNASEILALAGGAGGGRGVDAGDAVSAAEEAARGLARAGGCVVAVTGEIDFVTDGARALRVEGGHALMPRVTALGCALTCVVGACVAETRDLLAGTAAALAAFAVAGEAAGASAAGPASFQTAFLDALAALDGDAVGAARTSLA